MNTKIKMKDKKTCNTMQDTQQQKTSKQQKI